MISSNWSFSFHSHARKHHSIFRLPLCLFFTYFLILALFCRRYYSGTGCSGNALALGVIGVACPTGTPQGTTTCQAVSSTDTGLIASSYSLVCGAATIGNSPTYAPTSSSVTFPTAAPSYNLQAVTSSLSVNGASVTNALASAYPVIPLRLKLYINPPLRDERTHICLSGDPIYTHPHWDPNYIYQFIRLFTNTSLHLPLTLYQQSFCLHSSPLLTFISRVSLLPTLLSRKVAPCSHILASQRWFQHLCICLSPHYYILAITSSHLSIRVFLWLTLLSRKVTPCSHILAPITSPSQRWFQLFCNSTITLLSLLPSPYICR